MNWSRKGWILACTTALAFAAAAKQPTASKRPAPQKQTSAKAPRATIRSLGRSGGMVHLRRANWAPRARGTGFTDLTGDPGTGLGFYALPLKYRSAAWRYRAAHSRPWRDNPVLFAIAADAARYNYWIPGNRSYVYGVFNPYDGVGTPFSGGYYGASADDDMHSDLDGWP